MFVESFDGTRIWYDYKKQAGPCFVFIHGWANDWTAWKKEIQYFKKKGHSTLAIDLRGHGASDKPENKKKYTLSSFAKDIDQVLQAAKIKEFILIGHSMGGLISLKFYQLFPSSIKALILCDTTYRNVLEHKPVKVISPFIKKVLDFLIRSEHIQQEHFSHLNDIDLTQYKKASDYWIFYEGLHNTPMKSVFACLETMINCNLKPVLKKINIPVLIIEGSADKLLPKIDSLELYHEIKNAEIDFIAKGRHFVNLERPELVDKYINSFLKKHKLIQ